MHSELAALDGVLDAIDVSGIERIWCLGDLVGGRGTDPVATFDRVLDRCELVLAGNHDRIITGQTALTWRKSHPGIDASRAALDSAGGNRLLHMSGLSPEAEAIVDVSGRSWSISLAHGCPWPFDPASDYIVDQVAVSRVLDACDHDLVLVGHTHVPLAIGADDELLGTPSPSDDRFELRIPHGTRAVINPGSIAPGRDGNARPTWLELAFDEHEVTATWYRVGEPVYEA